MTAKDGRTVEQNTADGVAAYLACLRAGIPAFSPHLSGAFRFAWADVPYQTWLDYDFAVIDRCTHVCMLPRWETSTGATAERQYALDNGIPVLDGIEALIQAVAR
jgi:hypothetical protein